MKLREYRKRLEQNPDYVAAKRDLEPFLDIADDVLALRLEKGWSQTELARRASTRQANISRIESGLANPTIGFLQKLAKALNTELSIRLRPQRSIEHTRVIIVTLPEAISPWAKRETRQRETTKRWGDLPVIYEASHKKDRALCN